MCNTSLQPAKQAGVEQPDAAAVLRCVQQSMNTGAAWLNPLVRFARHMPACSGNILELHFNQQTHPVDFAARLNTSFDKGLLQCLAPGCFPYTSPVLPALVNQDGCGFQYGIENTWLKYDAPFRRAPAVFFDLHRGTPFCPDTVYNCLQRIMDQCGYFLNRWLIGFLQQVKQAQLHVVYYGLMFSRNSRSLRLTINGIRASQLYDVLQYLGWQGNYAALQKLQSAWLHDQQQLVLGVNFGDAVENRIGIDVFDENRPAFIRELYRCRHINAAEYQLLCNWEQRLELPAALQTGLTRVHNRPVSELYTRIDHFKFVINNSKEIAVKGYLHYCF